ncbi:peptidoglycan-binding protein [Halalkalibacterium halodurans]|jgi:3D (Asp-Asp-Asp) domain-containing protein|uniref:3D (Asp-Asp-Asp) domain-containing protein n=1 Tax=Halalkalibacterium halodurans TaxID=86665 RepID=A0A0M0KHD1_ALKHA|nr:peptidoglycan-binding protein [Halalkalibacterium halodurans]MED4163068.1 peptidoglycan-binding protein [Halalkalibacterium halodurans]TPE68638.1 peptidoglycan-binding protein [Halalkalibacterium halodurans]
MNNKRSSSVLRTMGVTVATAGFVLFAAPHVSSAAEKGPVLLHEGVESESVTELQKLLETEGYLDDFEKGVFHTETEEAVKQFQKDHELVVDGIAGPQTLGALLVLREGDEHEVVVDLKAKLEELKLFEGTLDQQYDEDTTEAVREFQEKLDLQVDGVAGPETFGQLFYSYLKDDEITTEPPVSTEPAGEEARETEEGTETVEQVAHEEEAASTSGDTVIEMEATAYTADCEGCSGVTATGMDLRNNREAKVVAVDPSVIPLGTRVHVEGYGEAVAADVGGSIQGNKIDLHMATKEDAINFGRQNVTVTILD